MQPKASLAGLLRTYPSLATTGSIDVLLQQIPLARLKTALQDENLPFPKGYIISQDKLLQLAGGTDGSETYKIKEGKEVKTVSITEYTTHWQATLERYSDEAYFKKRLVADIDFAFVTLQTNRDLIAEYKGMDEVWVKDALREVRAKDKKMRTKLTQLLQTIVSHAEVQPSFPSL